MPQENKSQNEKLIESVREAIKRDSELREKYQVTNKFRFIQDRLQKLLEFLEKHYETTQEEEKQETVTIAEDEALVYVHLFNAKGTALASWQNMVTPTVFYEYSVNRPIYAEKSHIEALIRTKNNKLQHAYLTVAVKKTNVVQAANDSSPKDSLGHSLIRVREGTLSFERLVSFTHNLIEYKVDAYGVLVKKDML